MIVDRAAVLGHRLTVNHLAGERLTGDRLADAAHAGLQDGSPRSALLSLDARVAGLDAEAWRHPTLAQVFGPRGAIYVVPSADVGVFSLGQLPRDPDAMAALRSAAARIHHVLDGRVMRQSEVVAALPDLGGTRALRWAATVGTLGAVWDTVDTFVVPRKRADIDEEAARLELARRFFRHLGPATTADLAWWLAADLADATSTVSGLETELVDVSIGSVRGYVLEATADLLAPTTPTRRVLLLPPDDAYIHRRARTLLVPRPDDQRRLWPQAPPPGALVLDGEVVGTWRRRGRRVTVSPWITVPPGVRSKVEEMVASWPLPVAAEDAAVTWLDPS